MINPFNVYSFLTDPTNYLLELQKKHGDPFPLSLPGNPTVWLTADSILTKTIFTAPADTFMPADGNPVKPLLGTEGLIMLGGNNHLEKRKQFIPYFSKSFLQTKASTINEVFQHIYQRRPISETLNLQQFALESTLKIILKFLFPHLTNSEILECETATHNFLKSYSASFLFVPKWVPGTFSGISNFNKEKVQLDDKFYYYFLTGLHLGIDSPLTKLRESPKAEVLDHIRTFIVAGHETSATSLVWALYFIHQSPYIKNRLFEELNLFTQQTDDEFIENVLQNKFLDAIISEALRIRPPVPFVTRKVTAGNFQLGDRVFETGEELGVCVTLLHRQNRPWSNPDEFRPERFLNNKYSPFEYAPFGGGTRKCIGAELAILEIKILVANFVKHYDSKLLEETTIPISEVLQITAGPKKPILLECEKRIIS